MKRIIQEIAIYSFSLYITSLLFSGLKINGGILPIIIGGLILAIGFTILKPILTVLTLPLHFLSLGLFSFITSAIVLYITTLVYKNIQVKSFTIQKISFLGLNIQGFEANGILSYVIISGTIYIISKLLEWLFEVE